MIDIVWIDGAPRVVFDPGMADYTQWVTVTLENGKKGERVTRLQFWHASSRPATAEDIERWKDPKENKA